MNKKNDNSKFLSFAKLQRTNERMVSCFDGKAGPNGSNNFFFSA